MYFSPKQIPQILDISKHVYKRKTWGSELTAHPALSGSRIAFQPRISNAEAHVYVY